MTTAPSKPSFKTKVSNFLDVAWFWICLMPFAFIMSPQLIRMIGTDHEEN